MKDFRSWISSVTGDDSSNREIALTINMPVTTFHRKWKNDDFGPEDAIAIARAYNRSPIEALVAQGSLTVEEASRAERGYSIREFTTLELSQELLRRVESQTQNPDYIGIPMSKAAKQLKSNNQKKR